MRQATPGAGRARGSRRNNGAGRLSHGRERVHGVDVHPCRGLGHDGGRTNGVVLVEPITGPSDGR